MQRLKIPGWLVVCLVLVGLGLVFADTLGGYKRELQTLLLVSACAWGGGKILLYMLTRNKKPHSDAS